MQSQPGEEATWAESGRATGAGLPKSHQDVKMNQSCRCIVGPNSLWSHPPF